MIPQRYERKRWLEQMVIPRFDYEYYGKKRLARTGQLKQLLGVIESHAREKAQCCLKLETIAHEMGVCISATQRRISKCKELGLLKVESSKSKHHPSSYEIDWSIVRKFILECPKTAPLIDPLLTPFKLNSRPVNSNWSRPANLESTPANLESTPANLESTPANLETQKHVDTSLARVRLNPILNSSETTPQTPPDEWRRVVEELKKFGVVLAEATVNEAKKNGFVPSQIFDLLKYLNDPTRKNGYGPGPIVKRIQTAGAAGWAIDSGWPPKSENAQAVHREEITTKKTQIQQRKFALQDEEGKQQKAERETLEAAWGAKLNSLSEEKLWELIGDNQKLKGWTQQHGRVSNLVRRDLLFLMAKKGSG